MYDTLKPNIYLRLIVIIFMINKEELNNDEELLQKEIEIKKILKNIEEKIDCNGLIAMIYNPLEGFGEILEGDTKNIYAFITGLEISQATILLHGPGGNFIEGMNIAYIFRNKFSTYKTFVPQICGSALCFPILKSDKLILLKKGIITQIDPVFEYEKQPFRAIKYLRSENPILKEIANRVFHYSEKQIFNLIKERPSLFQHDKKDFESVDGENIISAMLNRDEHSDKVEAIAFQFIPFNVEFRDDNELSKLCNNLIRQVQWYLMETERRYFIGSTYKTTINKHKPNEKKEGHLLFCP